MFVKKTMELLSNPQLELAFDFVCNTNKNIFLTGKAGTGKTTFLQRIKNEPVKRMAVVAPTGVAAINAGGMTIHSFFQLPFGPYLPGNAREAARQRKFSREKINLIRSLDLLVIDEISMVRADLLDGIDDVLRRYKDHYKPFGGVQLLMIGDLHQLPPVVKEEEWSLLRPYYPTPYFFSSQALQQTRPVVIELKHIFRQSDSAFIDLLNKVRDNKMSDEVLAALNSRYIAGFQPPEEDAYITLTTHNATAQEINTQKLTEVPGALSRFQAKITGDFPAHAYPTDEILELKTGAQVMFVKNDAAPEKRFFNGKIGKITKIEAETIYVKCPNDEETIAVGPVEWENIKYTLNEQTREVTEEVIGSFSQYPLKLAWAITIHKSQGLTFERVVLDAQAAFAHGQVYVALSRCKSFEGIVLRSRIAPHSVRTDSTVKEYSEAAEQNPPDEAQLRQSKIAFQQSLILELFDFSALKKCLEQLNRVFLEHENSLQKGAHDQVEAIAEPVRMQVFVVADKFRFQLQDYFQQEGLPEENEGLQERIRKASAWFAGKIGGELLPAAKNIQIVTDNKAVLKSATDALDNLQREMFVKNACFGAAQTAFSTRTYLRTKANAEIDFQSVRKTSVPPSGLPGARQNMPHPALFVRLLRWREHLAETNGVELYEIVPTKTLMEIAEKLPATLSELRKIKGIGKGKSQQFGAEIIAMVQLYCRENNIQTSHLPLGDVAPKTDTKTLSLELFKSGKSIDDIASERGLARSTIEGHLAYFIGLGELNIFDLMDEADVRKIEDFFVENNTDASSEAKAHFGETYSYGQIKMALEWMRREKVG